MSYTIVVDDIEDNSDFRRGKPSLHKIYGIDIAVNAGNAMYFLPLILLYNNPLNLNAKTKSKIYDLYARELLRVSFGQATDIYWAKTKKLEISEKEYLQMCYLKTGALARFSAELGAILGKGTEKQIKLLGDFAAAIGIAFQIKDDILNLKNNSKWGKKTGEDITEGKMTLMVIHALQNLKGKEKEKFIEILTSKTNDSAKIQRAISLIEKVGSIDYSFNKTKEILFSSLENLRPQMKDKDSLEKLEAFANYLVEREC